MLRRVALVRTDVSEELSVSIIRVTKIDELRTTFLRTSQKTPFLTIREYRGKPVHATYVTKAMNDGWRRKSKLCSKLQIYVLETYGH
jgi:hypothetical protein